MLPIQFLCAPALNTGWRQAIKSYVQAAIAFDTFVAIGVCDHQGLRGSALGGVVAPLGGFVSSSELAILGLGRPSHDPAT